jgi:hypothetical protein
VQLYIEKSCTAFEGSRCIASGDLAYVALKTKEVLDRDSKEPILIFDDNTGRLVEVDLRGSVRDVLNRLSESANTDTTASASNQEKVEAPRGPGRPKLGVVAREVTLLPRHWEWLNQQPGGASVALRKLVDEARHQNESKDRIRQAQETTYRFMSAMAGNLTGFEEATRALFAQNQESFHQLIENWHPDIRDHVKKLAAAVFQQKTD